jgi:hypothetical protein
MAVTFNIIEGTPIWEAIDKGGGQTVDIIGVIRELNKAGYVIINKNSMPVEIEMTAQYKD